MFSFSAQTSRVSQRLGALCQANPSAQILPDARLCCAGRAWRAGSAWRRVLTDVALLALLLLLLLLHLLANQVPWVREFFVWSMAGQPNLTGFIFSSRVGRTVVHALPAAGRRELRPKGAPTPQLHCTIRRYCRCGQFPRSGVRPWFCTTACLCCCCCCCCCRGTGRAWRRSGRRLGIGPSNNDASSAPASPTRVRTCTGRAWCCLLREKRGEAHSHREW